MLGRAKPLTPEQVRLLQLEALVDQARALAREAAVRNRGNRALVDFALDIDLLLAGKRQ